jgi:hypothetical protein
MMDGIFIPRGAICKFDLGLPVRLDETMGELVEYEHSGEPVKSNSTMRRCSSLSPSRIFDTALTRPGVRDNATDGQTTPHTEEPVMAAAKKTAKKTAKKASTKKAGAKKTKK